jgi:glyoxylase-like metal-dependent hydrolase (beta-lactamase superfamily II)
MEIVPGIHLIEGIFAHCYLVDGPELILIDTGMPRKTKKILRYITDTLHRTPTDLKTILLTHCDIDHIGNARELRSIIGTEIAAHPKDADIIAGKKTRQTPQKTMSILFKLLGLFLQVKPFPVDKIIDEGDTITGLTVIHIPGHTPGSIALYDSKRKVLFIGDTLGCKDGAVKGPPKSVTWDMAQAYQSIEKLRILDFTVMLSGHGEPLKSNASAKVRQFITKINENKTTR